MCTLIFLYPIGEYQVGTWECMLKKLVTCLLSHAALWFLQAGLGMNDRHKWRLEEEAESAQLINGFSKWSILFCINFRGTVAYKWNKTHMQDICNQKICYIGCFFKGVLLSLNMFPWLLPNY